MITIPTTLRGLARRLLVPDLERELADAQRDLAKAYKQINHDRKFFLGLDELADRCGYPEVNGLLYDRIEAAGEELATTKAELTTTKEARGVILQVWTILSRAGVPRVDAWDDAYDDVVKVAKATRAESEAARAVLDRVFAGTSEQPLADRIEGLITRDKQCIDAQSDAFTRLREAYGKEAQITAQAEQRRLKLIDDGYEMIWALEATVLSVAEELGLVDESGKAAGASAASSASTTSRFARLQLPNPLDECGQDGETLAQRVEGGVAAARKSNAECINGLIDACVKLENRVAELSARERELADELDTANGKLGKMIDRADQWKTRCKTAETQRDALNDAANAAARKAEAELSRVRHMLMMMQADRDTTAANLSTALEHIRQSIPDERVREIIAERDEARTERDAERDRADAMYRDALAATKRAEKAETELSGEPTGLTALVHAMTDTPEFRAKWGAASAAEASVPEREAERDEAQRLAAAATNWDALYDAYQRIVSGEKDTHDWDALLFGDCAHEHVDDLGNGWGRCRDCGDESLPMTAETAGQLPCCGSYGEHTPSCESEEAKRDREASENAWLARCAMVCLAPRPWRVVSDWTFEVTAADGTIVHKTRTLEEAEAICDVANADYERAENAEKSGAEHVEWHDEITSLIQDALDEASLPHDDEAGPRYELIAESVRQVVKRMLAAEAEVLLRDGDRVEIVAQSEEGSYVLRVWQQRLRDWWDRDGVGYQAVRLAQLGPHALEEVHLARATITVAAQRGHHRGHAMHETAAGWVYTDTGQLVSENVNRDCGRCGLANTPEGHDGCLGTLPGVRNACCGHGHDEPYLQLASGGDVRGPQIMRDHARLLDAARVLADRYAVDVLNSGALVGLRVDELDESAATAWRTVLELATPKRDEQSSAATSAESEAQP